MLIPAAVRSKGSICYPSLAGTAVSNPAGDMDVSVMNVAS